jgi:hypothetical protein
MPSYSGLRRIKLPTVGHSRVLAPSFISSLQLFDKPKGREPGPPRRGPSGHHHRITPTSIHVDPGKVLSHVLSIPKRTSINARRCRG